jgi:hypothetical protein
MAPTHVSADGYLALHVPTLWQETLPDFFAIGEAVRAMVEGQG